MRETLGDYIQQKRKDRGLSQRTLAKKAGLSPNTVNRIEKDEVKPGAASLEKIADALDVPLSRLTSILQNRSNKGEKHSLIDLMAQLSPKQQRLTEKFILLLIEENQE